MTFDAPFVLLCAPILGGAVWFSATWARRVRVRRALKWSVETGKIAKASGRFIPTGLSIAAFLGTIALAGPRWGEERIVAETRGLNLVVAVDISRSMLAEDAAPNRLGRAVREARRLVQDLDGDRLGLIAFAGQSYILSPLSVDASALELYIDALDPEMVSEGGTGLAGVLDQGRELVEAGSPLADRVLVVFTDGEAHDTVPEILTAAQRLARDGVHLVLVAEGGRAPARIPLRDDRGQFQGWQQDEDGTVIQTARRDDLLGAVADGAQGTLVAADLPDQAGAVRDLVASYKRSRSTESRAQEGRPRAWMPLTVAAALLLWASFAGRTAALIGLALVIGAARGAPAQGRSGPTSTGRWDVSDRESYTRTAYLKELARRRAGDTAWYDVGTAALAAGDSVNARIALSQAATSLDPEIRFRALYNLGLLSLLEARADSAHREPHLADAERAYREALLLKPHHLPAKWNLELAIRERRSGGSSSAPNRGAGQGGGGRGANAAPPPPPQPQSGGGGGAGGGGQLSRQQAEEILNSIGEEELRTRKDRTGRARQAVERGVKNW
jgi:Ca-activated chloride channel homolog